MPYSCLLSNTRWHTNPHGKRLHWLWHTTKTHKILFEPCTLAASALAPLSCGINKLYYFHSALQRLQVGYTIQEENLHRNPLTRAPFTSHEGKGVGSLGGFVPRLVVVLVAASWRMVTQNGKQLVSLRQRLNISYDSDYIPSLLQTTK